MPYIAHGKCAGCKHSVSHHRVVKELDNPKTYSGLGPCELDHCDCEMYS